jgi:hypothetical protein
MKGQYKIARTVLRLFACHGFNGKRYKGEYRAVIQPEHGISKDGTIYFHHYGLESDNDSLKKWVYRFKHRVIYGFFKKSNHYKTFGCKVGAEIYK